MKHARQNTVRCDKSRLASRQGAYRVGGINRREFIKASAISAATVAIPRIVLGTGDSRHVPLYYLSAAELARQVRSGSVSPSELVQVFVQRIREVNHELGAAEYIAEEEALAAARRLEEEIVHRRIDLSNTPLLGVPISVKEGLDTQGMPTTAGARIYRGRIPDTDATVVKRLKDAGAIVLVKSRMATLGLAIETANSFGMTNNPYDVTRTPGGSSGGEGALLAVGGSPLGIGVEQAESIRIPSHCCGIAGLCPAFGRISTAGIFPPITALDVLWYTSAGPMARFVDDVAMAYRIVAGPDNRDHLALPIPYQDYQAVDVKNLKIGFWTGDGQIEPDGDTSLATEAAARALEGRGARVSRIDCPYSLRRVFDIALSTMAPGWQTYASVLRQNEVDHLPCFAASIDNFRHWFEAHTASEVEALRNELPTYRETVYARTEPFDAFLCPVMRRPAAKHGQMWNWHEPVECGWVYAVAWCLPSGVVRCGTSADGGLPIGINVIGSRYREDVALRVMQELERELGGWQPPAGFARSAR